MTFGQNEKTNLENLLLALFLSIDIYIKSDYDENICSILFDQSQGLIPSLDEEWPRLHAENAKMCGPTRGVMRLEMMGKLALFTA